MYIYNVCIQGIICKEPSQKFCILTLCSLLHLLFLILFIINILVHFFNSKYNLCNLNFLIHSLVNSIWLSVYTVQLHLDYAQPRLHVATHTHTHTHIYIYIYTYWIGKLFKQDEFSKTCTSLLINAWMAKKHSKVKIKMLCFWLSQWLVFAFAFTKYSAFLFFFFCFFFLFILFVFFLLFFPSFSFISLIRYLVCKEREKEKQLTAREGDEEEEEDDDSDDDEEEAKVIKSKGKTSSDKLKSI